MLETTRVYSYGEVEAVFPEHPCLREVSAWLHDVIAQPHPKLGRTGAVCPFVPPALKADTVWLSVERIDEPDEAKVADRVRPYRDLLLGLEPRSGDRARFKTIVVVLPDVPPDQGSRLIDGVQRILKPHFVEKGTMLGEFHPRSEAQGIRNPDFRPLRSPVPLMVARFMVDSDFLFLLREEDPLHARIDFVSTYLRLLGSDLPPRQHKVAEEVLVSMRAEMVSLCDPLTRLANRRHFDEVLELEYKRATRTGGPLSVLLIEVAPMQRHREEYAGVATDLCLHETARLLSAAMPRAGDLLARYDGARFAAILPHTPADGAQSVASRLIASVANPKPGHPAPTPSANVRIGVVTAQCAREGSQASLVAAAQEALAEARRRGGTTWAAAKPLP